MPLTPVAWLPLESQWCEFLGSYANDPESPVAEGDVRAESHAEAVDAMCEVLRAAKGGHRAMLFLSSLSLAEQLAEGDLREQSVRATLARRIAERRERVGGIKLETSAIGFALIEQSHRHWQWREIRTHKGVQIVRVEHVEQFG